MIGKHVCTIGSACVLAAAALASASAAENLVLSRDGFFYVGPARGGEGAATPALLR